MDNDIEQMLSELAMQPWYDSGWVNPDFNLVDDKFNLVGDWEHLVITSEEDNIRTRPDSCSDESREDWKQFHSMVSYLEHLGNEGWRIYIYDGEQATYHLVRPLPKPDSLELGETGTYHAPSARNESA